MMKKTKKSNAKRKFAAAAAMLLISALVLSSATYAWFTMSREVEVKNIQLTATAPVDIQMSLGLNMYEAMTSDSAKLTAGNGSNGVGIVEAPKNTNDSKDWASTVAFYDFYTAPLLQPASSNQGTTIWTTADMTGIGRTIALSGTSVVGSGASLTLTDKRSQTKPTSGSTNVAYNRNNYVDFPIWFRTSSSNDVTLSVKAITYIGDNSDAVKPSGSSPALYKAARVSILKTSDGSTWTSDGVIVPYDGGNGSSEAVAQTNKYYKSGTAINGAGSITSDGTESSRGGQYGTVTMIKQTGETGADPLITVKGYGKGNSAFNGNSTYTSTVYGDATCVIVRVWLEGEDVDCYNATEGQDFKVNLIFSDVNASSGY